MNCVKSNVSAILRRINVESEAKNEALKLIAQVIQILENPEAQKLEVALLVAILKRVIDRLAQ